MLYLPISAVVALLILFLGGISYAAQRNSLLNKAFAVGALFTAAWIILLYLSDQVSVFSDTNILLFNRLVLGVAIVWIAGFMYVVVAFPHGRVKHLRLWQGIILLGLIQIPFILFSDKYVAGFQSYESGSNLITGSYYPLYAGWIFSLFSLFIIVSYLKLRKAVGLEKTQLNYLFWGILIFAIFTITFNLILPGVTGDNQYAKLGSFSVLAVVVSTSYAITKHKLFNIKVLFAEIVTAVLVVINTLQIFSVSTWEERLFWLVIAAIVAFVGALLVRSVQNEVRRREEVEELAKEKTKALAELEQRNKNLATLQKISRLVLDEIELKPMAQKILDEIPRELENCRGALLNLVKGGQLGAYAISSTDITEKIYRMVGADISKYSYPLKSGFNLLHDAILTKQAKESPRLSDFISPPIPKALALHGGTQVQLV